jgi:predicted metalloendopeptidase
LEATPVSTLRNYLRWQLTNSLASSLSDKDSEPYFLFYAKNLSGVKARTKRWERCYDTTASHLSDIMARAFVSVSFKGQSKEAAEELVQRIEGAFGSTLNTLSWLDDKTRAKAKVKLGALTDMIGYPENWKTYSKAIISDNHFANLLAIDKIGNDRNLAKLGNKVDKTDWDMSPAEVNAYYDPEVNTIVFPAAILQPPFFSTQQPMSYNFGAIGVVMGHELTHGFDDQGRLYDKDGALNGWWEKSTAKKFNAKAQCVAKQYSQFQLPGKPVMHLNGNLTIGENLADNGGSQSAFKAYKKWAAAQKGGLEGQKVGDFTGEQLFFYGFSQSWCTIQKTKSLRSQVVTDVHSPSEFRVNGAMANHPGFAKAFNCKVGSKMNPGPKKRCLVWADEADKAFQ